MLRSNRGSTRLGRSGDCGERNPELSCKGGKQLDALTQWLRDAPKSLRSLISSFPGEATPYWPEKVVSGAKGAGFQGIWEGPCSLWHTDQPVHMPTHSGGAHRVPLSEDTGLHRPWPSGNLPAPANTGDSSTGRYGRLLHRLEPG